MAFFKINHPQKIPALMFDSVYSYFSHGKVKEAETVLSRIIVEGNPPLKPYDFGKVLSSYIKLGDNRRASRILDQSSMKPDLYGCNAIVSAYCDTKKVQNACLFLDNMSSFGVPPNGFTYLKVVKALINDKQRDRAKVLIDDMILKGFRPDEFVWNFCYQEMCKHKGVIESFRMARINNIGNLWLYNMLVNQAASNSDFKTSRALIAHMVKSGFEPDEVTFDALISSYFKFREIEKAFEIVKASIGYGIPFGRISNTAMRSSLKLGLNGYVKSLAVEMEVQNILIDIDSRHLFLDSVYSLPQ